MKTKLSTRDINIIRATIRMAGLCLLISLRAAAHIPTQICHGVNHIVVVWSSVPVGGSVRVTYPGYDSTYAIKHDPDTITLPVSSATITFKFSDGFTKTLTLSALGCTVTPIVLNYFTVQKIGDGAIFKWETAMEQNSDSFYVQYWTGSVWKDLAGVRSQNSTSSLPLDYTVTIYSGLHLIESGSKGILLALFICLALSGIRRTKKVFVVGVLVLAVSCTKSNSVSPAGNKKVEYRLRHVDLDKAQWFSEVKTA